MTRPQKARRARQRAARQRIIDSLPKLRGQSLHSVRDIAYTAGVAQSTVRRYLPELIRDGYLQYTLYVGQYGLGRNVPG